MIITRLSQKNASEGVFDSCAAIVHCKRTALRLVLGRDNVRDLRALCRCVAMRAGSLHSFEEARQMSLADEIREAMTSKGVNAAWLSRESGINEGLLSRYFKGKSALSVKSLDALLDTLGYELTIRKKRKRKQEQK